MPSRIPNLRTCKKLGFIVPSSNAVVEPTCNALIQDLNRSTTTTTTNPNGPEIVALYTRIRVKTIGTDSASTSQFSTATLVEAAQLLADAQCDAILWNGTSGMWVGADLAADEALAKAMSDATGVPCGTTTLATVAALREKGFDRIALATPYTDALTRKCVDFFQACGFDVLRAERLRETPGSNLEIGRSPPGDAKEVVMRACRDEVPQAVIVACTNWAGAVEAQGVEDAVSSSMLVVDSVTVTVWMALRLVDWKGGMEGWGTLMRSV